MDVEPRYTAHQVARGTRPDAVKGSRWYLIKNASHLRLTYQIRLLTFMAETRGARVVILRPRASTLSKDLRRFVSQHHRLIAVEEASN